jgi:hypothetical protein
MVAMTCIFLTGCGTLGHKRLAKEYNAAWQQYWDVVMDVAPSLSVSENDVLRTWRELQGYCSELEAIELEYLLSRAPGEVAAGVDGGYYWELTEEQRGELLNMPRYAHLSKRFDERIGEFPTRYDRRLLVDALRRVGEDVRVKDAEKKRNEILNRIAEKINKTMNGALAGVPGAPGALGTSGENSGRNQGDSPHTR